MKKPINEEMKKEFREKLKKEMNKRNNSPISFCVSRGKSSYVLSPHLRDFIEKFWLLKLKENKNI